MKKLIVESLKKILREKNINLKDEEILNLIEIPPSIEMGDYSFPCFSLASKLKQNPNQIALDIKKKIGKNYFKDVQVMGGYVNFFIDREKFTKNLVLEILKKKSNFGKSEKSEKEKIVIEFSQPNTHKAFHVGHIRGTSLGESVSRILEFCGNKVVRVNYSGDTGMHVAKWIWCYRKYHSNHKFNAVSSKTSKEKLKNDESWISEIYVDAVRRLGENEDLQKEVDEINKKLESKKDKKLNDLWKKTRKISIDSWKKIYKELDTKFDSYFFESEVERRAKEISHELLKKGIAVKDDGAVIVNLKEYNLGVWILLRSDDTVLYSAKDLALAEKKIKKYNAGEYLIFVAEEQNLHFQQLLKTLDLMGIKKKYYFETFGMVRLPEGKMSSRTGDNILYSSFMKEITDYAKNEIKKRGEKISRKELEKRALIISVASVKYSMLKQSANKNIIFNKEEALNFEGDTGAYILYSYARASSIMHKASSNKIQTRAKSIAKKVKSKKSKISFTNLEDKEINLVKIMSQFPETVLDSGKNTNPSTIANYTYHLAQKFNEFYHSCPVIGSEKESLRIELVKSFIQVMENSMNLLGIKYLDRM
jgi:arginyl-tRNA synthetase